MIPPLLLSAEVSKWILLNAIHTDRSYLSFTEVADGMYKIVSLQMNRETKTHFLRDDCDREQTSPCRGGSSANFCNHLILDPVKARLGCTIFGHTHP